MNQTLRRFGPSVRKLLRTLLGSAQGANVETLCVALGVTHNAVRQHLTTLIHAGWVERGHARQSGGRPQLRYVLTEAGRELFPRNYAMITIGILDHLYASVGPTGVQAMLTELGRELGSTAAQHTHGGDTDETAQALAAQLDALGYEAQAVRRDGETQIEAYNCVFHTLARAHPEICRFDLAFMEAASRRKVQHLECIVRGGGACRFRLIKRGDEG